jgi:hypothetical protein
MSELENDDLPETPPEPEAPFVYEPSPSALNDPALVDTVKGFADMLERGPEPEVAAVREALYALKSTFFDRATKKLLLEARVATDRRTLPNPLTLRLIARALEAPPVLPGPNKRTDVLAARATSVPLFVTAIEVFGDHRPELEWVDVVCDYCNAVKRKEMKEPENFRCFQCNRTKVAIRIGVKSEDIALVDADVELIVQAAEAIEEADPDLATSLYDLAARRRSPPQPEASMADTVKEMMKRMKMLEAKVFRR